MLIYTLIKKIADLINGAPTTLDTLKEIADAMTEHEEVVDALEQSIGLKANQSEVDSHINNNTIHTSATEKATWNKAAQDIDNKVRILDNPNANCEFRFPSNEDGSTYYYLNVQPNSMIYAHYEVDHPENMIHYWSFNPNELLSKSGGTVTGNLAVTGGVSVTGAIDCANEIYTTCPNNGRIAYGGSSSYGSFWRNDGATLYLMFTNKGDQYGTWNSLRPLFFNLSTGEATFGHSLGVHGVLEVNGHIKVGNNTIGTTEIQSANPVAFRSAYGSYGAMFYNDGDKLFYFLCTNKNDTTGSFNDLRPFWINMSNGCAYFGHSVYMNSTLSVDGTIYTGTPVQVTSDRRAKENIENLDERYFLLWDELQPKSYYMKADKEKRNHIGYVAQEVEEAMQKAGLTYEECGFIHKKWVEKEDYEGYEYSLNYDGIAVIAQAKIKQQEERINTLEKEIAELKELIINRQGAIKQ